jgi:dolichol-phosphate mannosyltransferase
VSKNKTVIFIPTYNERDHAQEMCQQLLDLGLKADLLFLDDNSPDGTGDVLDDLARKHGELFVIHRSGKLGVGSAHLDGIAWAYDRGYEQLITLDCDFTHSPADVLKLLSYAPQYDVVVGSRFLAQGSLPDWKWTRRVLTHCGHFLTRHLLGISQDATGALRIYNLSRIPRSLFTLVKSQGYSFFFESMFLLLRNGCSVHEVDIVLPARTYGQSKMALNDIMLSMKRMLTLFLGSLTTPTQYVAPRPFTDIDPKLVDPQGWDGYWDKDKRTSGIAYGVIATVYRNLVIKRRLNQQICQTFPNGTRLLHAGCGSGQVDTDIQHHMRLTAVDISPSALQMYQMMVPNAEAVRHASIFALPFADGSFEGIYNVGVMEHFKEAEIQRILAEFSRVLADDAMLMMFWPHSRASSAMVLDFAHWVLNDVLHRNVELHPPEITRIQSKAQIEDLLGKAGFTLQYYYFGISDFFVQAVIVAKKASIG